MAAFNHKFLVAATAGLLSFQGVAAIAAPVGAAIATPPAAQCDASANSAPAPVTEQSAAPADPVDWQSMLDKAEPLYKAGNFKDALPLYKEAGHLAHSGKISGKDQIKVLRYWADCLCRLNQPDDALQVYEHIGELIPASDIDDRIENMSEQALAHGLKGDISKAETILHAALKLCNEHPGPAPRYWALARINAHLGYFEYIETHYEAAAEKFSLAADYLNKSKRNDLVGEFFREKMAFAEGGAFYHLKRWNEAYAQFKQTYEQDVKLFGKSDLQSGWAMLAMSDISARLGKKADSEEFYKKAVYVFRKCNRESLITEFSKSGELAGKDITAAINQYIFGKSVAPTDLADDSEPMCKDSNELVYNHDPRALYARPLMDTPGRVWLNPLVKQRGIVVAIHGLSLQHSSYDALAKQLADDGFCTVAFDIRGFGAYQQALGAEHLDFDGCMQDIHQLVSSIKNDNPGMPIFILGESMGGAIAMQFAANNPRLVDGLIASVPAGKRFKQSQTTLRVALHYFSNRHRQFDIGTDVIKQATNDPKLKEAWGGDPKTRGTLSAQELLQFQLMCDKNLESAKKIQKVPVIVFQGVEDGLIKPESTYELFKAMGVKDKSLVMVGNAEHLIFEENCFTPAVYNGLVAWMDAHLGSDIAMKDGEIEYHHGHHHHQWTK